MKEYAVGDTVLLPAGTPISTGRLRADTVATVDGVRKGYDGRMVYEVSWAEKGGRRNMYWRSKD
jgi:hypothetical protein